jgi:hypothetical protein
MLKLIFNTRSFYLACAAWCSIWMIACDKDNDNPNSGKVELLSFGPTGTAHGDTLFFVGNNLNKVTAIHFTGESAIVEQKDFKAQTPGLIKLLVPAAAVKGYVTLKTSDGDIVSKTQLNLGVATVVNSMTERARPGENLTINGNFLNWVTKVTFAKDKVVETFVSQSIDKLVVKIPDDAETGPVILTYSGTDSADVETADTLYVTLPQTTGVSPNPVKPKTDMTITGTDLDLVRKVILNGVASPITDFVSQTATSLVVNVPETAKKGKIILEAASGVQTTSTLDADLVLPQVTAIAPNPTNINTNITITGTDLDLVKKIIFAGVAPAVTSFVSQSLTSIEVKVPAGSRRGQLTLEAASGVQTKSAANLDIVLPTITSFAPNPVDPGANLTINGTRLDMVNGVTFQNAAMVTAFVSQSAGQIVVKVPMGVLRGAVTLNILNSADTIKSAGILEITGDAPPPTLAFPIYNDAVTSNWTSTGWVGDGWGGTKDYNNTSPVREGTKSVRVNYEGGWGSPMQLGGANVKIGSYTTFHVSIYGGAGSGGKKINVGMNGQDKYVITLVEGKWTDYAIPLSSLIGGDTISEIIFKEYNGTGGFTIYVDAVGLN